MRKKNDFVYGLIKKLDLSLPFFDIYFSEQYAQCGEDIIVAALLRAFATREGKDISTFSYLEIGAHHPVATSSTYLLHTRYGMSGVLVEANPHLIADLVRIRPYDKVVAAAVTDKPDESVPFTISNSSELSSLDTGFLAAWPGKGGGTSETISVRAIRMNDLMQLYFNDAPPVYLSIDVEGMDLNLLKDMDFSKYRPCIVQAEPSEHYIKGNTDQITEYMNEKDYILIARTDVNLVFSDRMALLSRAPLQQA